MLQACSSILRDRPEERGIIHCHSRALQLTVSQHLMPEFGKRIITHGTGLDRDGGIKRLRQSRNGVLCSVGMTEGLDLPDEDARFCIFAKVPWPNLSDPYIAERRKRSQSWYENLAAFQSFREADAWSVAQPTTPTHSYLTAPLKDSCPISLHGGRVRSSMTAVL